MITYTWRGHNRRGQLQHGKAQVEPGQLLQYAQTTLDNGWITLSIMLDGDAVAGIRQEGGQRVAWSAEGEQHEPGHHVTTPNGLAKSVTPWSA